jgi:hypothetical protein
MNGFLLFHSEYVSALIDHLFVWQQHLYFYLSTTDRIQRYKMLSVARL